LRFRLIERVTPHFSSNLILIPPPISHNPDTVAKTVPDQTGCARVARCITAHLTVHPDDYVAIHCSYGFNRTGLVCCACTYM
jgi:protein-tyrosine phosphatase